MLFKRELFSQNDHLIAPISMLNFIELLFPKDIMGRVTKGGEEWDEKSRE